jgi:hypothetical protein
MKDDAVSEPKEGSDLEVSFARREDAFALARATGRAWGSCRLFP